MGFSPPDAPENGKSLLSVTFARVSSCSTTPCFSLAAEAFDVTKARVRAAQMRAQWLLLATALSAPSRLLIRCHSLSTPFLT